MENASKFLLTVALLFWSACLAAADPRFTLGDVFKLEFASDPQVSPDGEWVAYARNFMDIMNDEPRSNIWLVRTDGQKHRPLTAGDQNDALPRWSPDQKRISYISKKGKAIALMCRWLETGEVGRLARLNSVPDDVAWSPDGKYLAFSMFVPEKVEPYVEMPEKPAGAKWAASPKVIDQMIYRFDGKGYLKKGYHHIFVLPAEGGSPRQVTSGPYHHQGRLSWTPDGRSLIFSANRSKDADFEPRRSHLYEVAVADGTIKQLTNRNGPARQPTVSPDGKRIAYVGFEDKLLGYQVMQLYVMNRDGSNHRLISARFDRDVEQPIWSRDGKGLFFSFDDQGHTKIAYFPLAGKPKTLASGVGGTTLGRPYASGSFSASGTTIAFTYTTPFRPADVAVFSLENPQPKRITTLNEDLFGQKKLGQVEEFWFTSSFDRKNIHGWIVKPPDFDPKKKYPLILEIHGGPFANYGSRFSAEIQLYASAGYVVVYINPRGSTSYGQDFGNLIHHNYPGQDFDDLMSGVDAVIKKGYIDDRNLFVTGGSGGGVLSSWIVGHTDRFRAAVVCKPVINWYSFALTADAYGFFYKYWFADFPWNKPQAYLKRSPISYAGNVKTPTMILTGEQDHRTPISESEQFYQALKLRKVDTVLVRVPGASHNIARRPSQLIAKVAHVLKWFDSHRAGKDQQ
ncbi:MAG: acyl-peptide hydrolase [Gemmatales bacterium]|nr:MAG: acyl-peptide hydrolase [Gemmatales bacterium]